MGLLESVVAVSVPIGVISFPSPFLNVKLTAPRYVGLGFPSQDVAPDFCETDAFLPLYTPYFDLKCSLAHCVSQKKQLSNIEVIAELSRKDVEAEQACLRNRNTAVGSSDVLRHKLPG